MLASSSRQRSASCCPPRLAKKMGCGSIPEPSCCCGSVSTWTYVLVFLGVLQLIGCIVMLAVPPPELCEKVPEVGGFSQGNNCSLMPDELPPAAKGIGAVGTVFLAVFCAGGAYAGYLMSQGEALKEGDKDDKKEVGTRLQKFYILLWWMFFGGLFLNTVFSIASERRLNPGNGIRAYL